VHDDPAVFATEVRALARALGTDARAHAWAAWCRLVAGLLRDGAPGLALAAAPGGEVRLVPRAATDADLGWSGEPGRRARHGPLTTAPRPGPPTADRWAPGRRASTRG
jgi:hypothetical protein